ncbi:ATP-dependent helicase upf1 [Trametes pubescens]|uniref:ATP-dependent helicase upf1 n=1 Tax=Trametes pubescens TaxID=154538 RepID=A0A1M2VVG9_TRAPU|nr:ATP-dependent helicase upf1 [Trametes pubescens]
MQTGNLYQDILPYPNYERRIRLHRITTRQWGLLTEHLSDEAVPVCGVSMQLPYKEHGVVNGIAFATITDVFYAGFAYTEENLLHGKNDLARVLDGSLCVLVGFGMARLALHLHQPCRFHVEGVELSTLSKKSTTAADFASKRIQGHVNTRKIHALAYGTSVEDVCLRAWLSAVLATDALKMVQSARKVNTRNLPDPHLACLSRLLLNVELLEGGRSSKAKGEIKSYKTGADGRIVLENSRYNTRVRRSNQTSIIIETEQGHSIVGNAVRADGKKTTVKIAGGNFRGNIKGVCVEGREELTSSELARDDFILRLLQGFLPSLVESPYIRMLWFATEKSPRHGPTTIPPLPKTFKLNRSQEQVVGAMQAETEPLVIVHGPPGTGKTSTIAAALHLWEVERRPVWVIAQSNVGVQNIAEKLHEQQIDFKLLVSKEFHFEWHEDLYKKLKRHFIRSDELFAQGTDVVRTMGTSTIVLCTVSMLSNPAIDQCGIFHLIPVERLVVDEASQIDTFEFMHLFHKFRKLQKVCMFGDPKQLPPYGKETAPEMKTIYDFEQFKDSTYFLDTQYRMPTPLGDFISEEVYENKLKSVHNITDRSAVRFVDVWKGREELVGSSWKNTEEARAVVNTVKNYYKAEDLCIITPYDAQRAEITRQLKSANLPCDRVFNVDSFQGASTSSQRVGVLLTRTALRTVGHDADFVVVSTVRTGAPGFLRSYNRTNVMLTRCKRGMVIVSKRDFLQGPGKNTLLGKLAKRWSNGAQGGAYVWINALALSGGQAYLPTGEATLPEAPGHGNAAIAAAPRPFTPVPRPAPARAVAPRPFGPPHPDSGRKVLEPAARSPRQNTSSGPPLPLRSYGGSRITPATSFTPKPYSTRDQVPAFTSTPTPGNWLFAWSISSSKWAVG